MWSKRTIRPSLESEFPFSVEACQMYLEGEFSDRIYGVVIASVRDQCEQIALIAF